MVEPNAKNAIEIFKNEEFGEIRTLMIDNDPWFVAKDIADKLGYAQTSNMMKRIDKEDSISSKLDGMNMKSLLINESGLYSAIIGSKLESAKRFKHWVTSEVLPSIRKHGAYATGTTIDNIINNPDPPFYGFFVAYVGVFLHYCKKRQFTRLLNAFIAWLAMRQQLTVKK